MKLEDKVKDALRKFIDGKVDVMGRYESDDGQHRICIEELDFGHIVIDIVEHKMGVITDGEEIVTRTT